MALGDACFSTQVLYNLRVLKQREDLAGRSALILRHSGRISDTLHLGLLSVHQSIRRFSIQLMRVVVVLERRFGVPTAGLTKLGGRDDLGVVVFEPVDVARVFPRQAGGKDLLLRQKMVLLLGSELLLDGLSVVHECL